VSGELVLVVDDEAIARDNVAYMLRKGGYVVLTAEDGLGAIEIFENRKLILC